MTPITSPPRFSIVVPAYNVQAWIRVCLESLLAQTFEDFEVVIVDDRGSDRSIAIASEFTGDDRFRIIQMPENGGLGPARNLGIAESRGEYILLVDSDDLLRADALERFDRELESRPGVDLILFDYARLNWWGTARPNSNNEMLRRYAGQIVDIDSAPDLLTNFHVAWNKVYRREWLEQLDLKFYPGYYEDVPWTYPALMAARSVAVLPEALYFYRQRYDGSILNSRSSRHLEVLDQYERLFDEASKLPNFEQHAGVLYERLVFHVRSLGRLNMDRIPRADKPAFYRRSSEIIERYRKYEDPTTPSSIKLRTRLLGSPAWPMFPVLKALSSARSRLKTRLGKFVRKSWVGRVRLTSMNLLHHLAIALPQRNRVVVYMSYWGRNQSCNPSAIYEAQRARYPEVRAYWVLRSGVQGTVDDDSRLRPGSFKERWVTGRATHIVKNVNLPDWFVKRPGATVLQTQHGTPLKVMGLHVRGTPAAPKMSYSKLLDRCAQWDYCLSSNPFSTETWPSAFAVSFEALEAGYPRNDCLYDDTYIAAKRADVRRSYGIPPGATLILYAPTFHEYESTFTTHVDWPSVLDQLPDDVWVMERSHHSYRLSPHAAHPRLVNASAHRLVEELYVASDILVTDYSSVMFDFANLERPIIIKADDIEQYRKYRGFYFDIRDELSTVVASTDEQLVQMLLSRSYESTEALLEIKRFREKFCPFDDGHAADRVVDHLFADTTSQGVATPGSTRH